MRTRIARTSVVLIAATAVLLAACDQPPDVLVESPDVVVQSPDVVVEPPDVVVQSPDVLVESVERPTGIFVSGQGLVAGVPDTLNINIGVSVTRDTVGEAVSDAAELADGVISALVGQGVAEEDIRTAQFSISPEFDFERRGRTRLIGYRVENRLSVKIRDLDRAGEIIDGATTAAGDEVVVSRVSFSVEDNEALLEEARAAAWSDAQAKATQLALLAGVELGAATTVSESVGATFPQNEYSFVFGSARLASGVTPIQPGQLDVTVILQVRFDID